MGVIEKLFRRQIQEEAVRQAGLYNEAIFGYLRDNQLILDEDAYDYTNAFKTAGAVYECVDLIIKKIAACPRIVYRVKDKEKFKQFKTLIKSDRPEQRARAVLLKAAALEEVKIPQIEKLLKRPNSKQNGSEFIKMVCGVYLLRGNSYMYGNSGNPADKKWSELFSMPGDMKIISGGPFEPIKEYFLLPGQENDKPFPAPQIKHMKTFNPSYGINGEQLYGVSPIRAYVHPIDNIRNANIQSEKQLKSGGELGFLAPKEKSDTLGGDQKKTLKEGIIRAFTSGDALARIIPSNIPLDWTPFGLSAADMQLIEVKGTSADDVYLAYHVPLVFRRTDSMTYNNLGSANKQFIYNAVAPVADDFSAAFTEFVCEPYEKTEGELIVWLDYTALPELSEDMAKMAEWLKNTEELTPNEKREVMGFGRSELPGMDEVWINKNKVRMQDVMDGKIDQSGGSTGSVDPTAQN